MPICASCGRAIEGDFAFKGRYFHNLQEDEQNRILDYSLMVYFVFMGKIYPTAKYL